MDEFIFSAKQPFDFHWIGKFQAPDENWIHMTRPLSDFELVIVTDGDFHIGDNNISSTIHTGEYRIMKPTNFQHGTKKSKCAFYWMHFSAKLLENKKSEDEIISLPVQGFIPRPERLIVLMKQLQDCEKKYNNKILNNYLCTSIICELQSQLCLLKNNPSQTNLQTDQLKGAQVALYSDIVNYINWKIHEDIRVSEIASYFGYNDKYITTFFKKASGKPIKQFILERKIEEAKAMLSDSTIQVAQIGYKLGFADNHNFARTFKKITGQSPSDYRDNFADRMLYNV